MSIYQFLEKIGQEEKKGYLSVCVNRSLRREQDVKALSTFNISCNVLLAKHFLSILLVSLNFWNTNPFIIDAYNIFTLRNR